MSDLFKERWMQWVALTTTVLAVFAAISSLRASTYSTRASLATTEEANRWSYFQAKSIKQHACEMQRDLFGVLLMQTANPEAKVKIEERLKACETDIARYDNEKAEIKTEAEGIGALENGYKLHSASFGMAAMLLQIAIMMSSVAALIKKPYLWALGLIMGAGGTLCMVNGFLLWF